MKTTNQNTPHLTPEQIERYALPAEAPDPERARANAHIQSCAACRAAFQQALRPSRLGLLNKQADPAEACPDADLMARYTQKTTDGAENETVEMHLETCAFCRSETAQLAAFYQNMEENREANREEQPFQSAEKGMQAAQTLPGTAQVTMAQPAQAETAARPTQAVGVKASLLPALPTRLPTKFLSQGAKWPLALGGSALAGVAATLLLLHLPRFQQPPVPQSLPQQPSPSGAANVTAMTAQLRQATLAGQTLQEQLKRQNRLTQAELQTAQSKLERQKRETERQEAALRKTQQLLAGVEKRKHLLEAEAKTRYNTAKPGYLQTLPKSSEQIVADSRGNAVYVIPVDPKESALLSAGRLDLHSRRQQIASLARVGGQTMGASEEQVIALLRPGGTFVSSLRPTFAWKAVPQASGYELTCFPKNGRVADVLKYAVPANARGAASDVVWTIPSEQPALEAQTTYTWTVQASGAQANSSKDEEIRFRTLAPAEISEVESRRRQYAGNPFLMGLVYARLGALEEADQAFAQALKANPANDRARSMQKQVRAQQAAH